MIDRLTPDQERDLPLFLKAARADGLRLQWATETEMRDAVAALYVSRGLAAPRVLVFDDPVQCLMARSLLRDQLGDQLRDQLRGQLRGQLGGQLGDQLGDQLWDQLGDQLWDQLRGQLWDQLGGQFRGQLGDQLRGQLGDQLWDQLGGQLGDQLYQELWFAGGSELYWIALYAYAERIGVRYPQDQSAALAAWGRYARTCGPLYPYDGWAFVSRRPDLLAFDDQGRLHAENGPAMRFPSGYAMHAWHGVRVPAAWIEDRASLTPQAALTWENIEQRRAACGILGWASILRALSARVVDEHHDPAVGTLVEVDLPGDEDAPSVLARFLSVHCGTGREFALGVPSDVDSATAAQAWLFGEDAYHHPEVRT